MKRAIPSAKMHCNLSKEPYVPAKLPWILSKGPHLQPKCPVFYQKRNTFQPKCPEFYQKRHTFSQYALYSVKRAIPPAKMPCVVSKEP